MIQIDIKNMCLTNKLHIQTAANDNLINIDRFFINDGSALIFLLDKYIMQLISIHICQRSIDRLNKILPQIRNNTSQRMIPGRAGIRTGEYRLWQ